MAHRLAPEAEADLDDTWPYVAVDANLETADRLIHALTTRFFPLGRHPRAGRKRDDLRAGIRSFAVAGYIVVYRLDGEGVLVLRVLRDNRDLDVVLGER